MKFDLLATLIAKISMLTLMQPYHTEINSTEISNLNSSNNPLYSSINSELANVPYNIDHMYDFKKTAYILSREKREARAGRFSSAGRGGGGRGSIGRSGRSYRGGSYRSGYRSYVNNRPSYRISKNYFTGKKWYNLNGKPVNLYKNLLYTKSGKTKRFITTTKGVKYKINKVNNWLNIKTKDKFTISTLPKTVQYKHNNNLLKLAVCNFYFNYYWNSPLEVHFLHTNNNLLKLLFIPGYEDKSMIDIGYYDNNKPDNSFANSTIEPTNATTDVKRNSTFIKLASIPKGGNISFSILNKTSSKPLNSKVSPPKINNAETTDNKTTTPEFNITSFPYNNIIEKNTTKLLPLPIIINSNNTTVNHKQNITPLAKLPFNSKISYNANNITQINSLLTQQNILDTASQLIIMSDNDIIKIVSLPQKVNSFLINSNNDTILTYSMNDPEINKKRNNIWWYSNSATTGKKVNSMVLLILILMSTK